MFLYKISNTVNIKLYYGQTINSIKKRWTKHKTDAKNGSTLPIHRAMRKYGKENFKIEEIDGANSQSELNYKEWLIIANTKSNISTIGYNLREGGAHGALHPDTKKALSLFRLEEYKRPFNVYNKNNQALVGTWNNQTTCADDLNLNKSAIAHCLSGKTVSHQEYAFCFIENLMLLQCIFGSIKIERSFDVYKKDTNEYVGSWNNRSKCAGHLQCHREHIYRCLFGIKKSTKGFIFKFKEIIQTGEFDMSLDYKQKYTELRNNLISSTDLAYKLGFEAGLNQAQLQNAQQQASDAQAQLQALQNPQQVDANGQPVQNQPGQPASEQSSQISGQNGPVSGQPSQMGQQLAMDEGQGTELDNHINELEGLISKGQKPSLPELRQKLEQIQDLRKSQRQSKPQTKKVESTQAKLLKNILDGWKQEAPKVSNSIADIIAQAEQIVSPRNHRVSPDVSGS